MIKFKLFYINKIMNFNIVMSWPHDLLCDLVSHYIQQHSTKFTDCTYLSPCS